MLPRNHLDRIQIAFDGHRLGLEGGVELVSEIEAPHDNRSMRELTGRIIVVDSSLTQL